MLRIAIVDDHQIIIDGLKMLLRGVPGFTVVAEANTAEDMLEKMDAQPIDLLITDIGLPNGIDGIALAQQVRHKHPGIKVLALSMSEDGWQVAGMIENAKTDGYIPKTAGRAELLKAIECIQQGELYFAGSVLQQYEDFKAQQVRNEMFNLSERELEVLTCMLKHLSNKEIAASLFISERTVETHRKTIFKKTGTKGIAALSAFVAENRILPR
jgi:DNA-binding NarL/FixJ family response regulator